MKHEIDSCLRVALLALGALVAGCSGTIEDAPASSRAPAASTPAPAAPVSAPQSAAPAPLLPGAPAPAANAVTFLSDIRPILIDNCGRCHAAGGLPNFASTNAADSYAVARRESEEILEELEEGEMPADTCRGAPGSNGCISLADFELIEAWVEAGAPE